MRKLAVGALVGLMLIASQATAGGASPPLRVADRVGEASGEASRLDGEYLGVPTFVWVGGILIVVFVSLAASQDNDSPASS